MPGQVELRVSFQKLQSKKERLLADVSSWSDERLAFRPDPLSWSTLNVIDHLVKVEISALSAIRKNLPNTNRVGLRDRISAQLVIGLMQSPMRVKVPASAKSVIPASAVELSALSSRWSEVRAEMDALLQGLQPAQIECGLFKHPVSGWMTMPLAISFLSAHMRHHDYQIERLKRASHGL